MSRGAVVIFIMAFAIGSIVVTFGLAVAFRPRVQRRLYAGTGIERWRSTASGLPWADRWVLFWANSWGRAVPRRLASLAVERGEVMLAASQRVLARGSKVRRFWLGLGALWVLLGLLNLGNLLFGDGGWLNLVPPIMGLATVFLMAGPGQVWQARLTQQSADLNRRQLEESPEPHQYDGP